MVRNVLSAMNPLAQNTPAKVASVGISTRATMLTVIDQDRASRISSDAGQHHRQRTPQCQQRDLGQVMRSHGHRRRRVAAPQVAAAPDGLDAVVLAEFGPQPLDVHGDGGQVAEVPVPHPLEQFLAGEDGVGVGQEEHQQVELAVGQTRPVAPATVTERDAVATVSAPTVISNGTVGGRRRGRAAQHRTDPQRQFARAERFGQVVVGAGLQPGDPVVLLARGRSAG